MTCKYKDTCKHFSYHNCAIDEQVKYCRLKEVNDTKNK